MSDWIVATEATRNVLFAVANERDAQTAKWGEQNHDPMVWGAILGEEVGELAQAMLNDKFGGSEHTSHSSSMRAEAVQVAAVAVAFIEYLDRSDDHKH